MNALVEWLGEGGVPVIQSLAESRAQVCQNCPENREPNWWERIKCAIADAIKSMLAVKHAMGVSVPNESLINMCGACGCCCRLIVHAPIQHIANGMTPEKYFKHPPHCWKRKELPAQSPYYTEFSQSNL